MNVNVVVDASSGDIESLEEALISHCRLSPEQVAQTLQTKRSQQLGFIQAAVKLGFITQADAESALEWALHLAKREDPGVIESALRRKKTGESNIVRARAIRVKPGPQLILAHDQGHARSERIRALRTELLLRNDYSNHANPLALVSPGAGEGRSQLAAELAIAFSQTGQKTLLIDADLRRPRQHMLFGALNERGLAQTLNSGEPLEPLGVEGLAHLSVVLSGQTVPNPLELLADGRFERMLRGWRYEYQFIVIDTPPVSEYADGLLIASLATRVLTLSRANLTSHAAMREMLRRLAATQSRILGSVLSHF